MGAKKSNEKMIEDGKTIMNTRKRLVTKRAPYVPSTDNVKEELRTLVKQHYALTKDATALGNMSSNRKVLDRVTHKPTGKVIPCPLPYDVQEAFKTFAKDVVKARAKDLESEMHALLKGVPIYDKFLRHVFGVGDVVSAYLISEIDIHRSIKSSQLRRFCGMAVDKETGRLERRTKGSKNKYCSKLRVVLYQAFTAMSKNAVEAKNREGKIIRHQQTSKYLENYRDNKHRRLMALTAAPKCNDKGEELSPKGPSHSYGWHKAMSLFVEDLYTVWRAMEGLEVWPSYYAAKLGYEHGGKISVNAPKKLTLEEALELVGEVGGTPCTSPPAEESEVEEIEEEAREEMVAEVAEEI